MEEVKVCDLATEFQLKNSMVISELKKIGVWVPSSKTPLDQDIASRIRRRLQLLAEIELDQQTKAEKAKEKKKKAPAKARRATKKTIRQLGKPRKSLKPEPSEEVEAPVLASPLGLSMKPRKGKASYRGLTTEEETLEAKVEEVSIYDEPLIEKVEAHVTPETLEAMSSAVVEPVPDKPATPEEPATTPVQDREETAPTRTKATPAAEEPDKKKVRLAPPPRKLKIISRPVLKAKEIPPEVPKTGEKPALVQPAAQVETPVVRTRTRGKKQADRPVEVTLPETVTVKELSEKLQIKSKEVLRELLQRGVLATINHSLDQATSEIICEAFDVIPNFVTFEESVIEVEATQDSPADLVGRAPVVTVMGHVDHGKTSLLDAIRSTDVAGGEAGGITQHIGAYHVDVGGKKVVFLDTPGHEAFTMMRSRGAQATDIVVLVVAADDGVMPQTREAIDHARAAGVPIIVAINKIDKPEADIERVKQQLTEHELIGEAWGGDTVMVEVSAAEETNLEQLLEMILLVAEIQELQANPDRMGSGLVLEARLDKGRGSVATILVQNGTVRVGDPFIAGISVGKIRAMFDDRGKKIRAAEPSSAIEILGFQGLPDAGDPFQIVEDAGKAKQIAEYRNQQTREKGTVSAKVSLDDLYAQLQAGDIKELPVVLKADAQGSVEVLKDSLNKLSTDKVKIKILMSAVGAIRETDVLFASASTAIIIGFNVRPEQNAGNLAERENVEIRLYTVIYDIAAEIKKAMVGLLDPTLREAYQGRAEVRELFKVPKFGLIAGCYVQDGQIHRNSEVRLLRDNVVVFEGKLDSVRRFKDDVATVKTGYECGLSIANYNDLKPGDIIEAFTTEEVAPELS